MKLFSNNVGVLFTCTRTAKKRSGGLTRNKQSSTNPANRRARKPKKFEGDWVERGMILQKQIGLKYYPGENVGCSRDLTLFALEPGRVVVSEEVLSPYPHSPLYPAVQAGRVFTKLFYHVIPETQHCRFKLISQV